MRIFINNEEVVCTNDIQISEKMLSTSSTILKNCYPLSWETTKDYTQFWFPLDYSKCLIYDGDDLIFCGVAKNTGNVSLNPREFHGVDLQILDFKDMLSSGETLNYVITGKTIVEAINQVVNSISNYGFVVGNIQILNPTDTINAYSTLNKTAYDVFQYIASITQSRWFTRTVDENTVAIDFYDPSLMPSGLTINSTIEFYKTYDIKDMTFNYSTNKSRI